MLQQEQPDDFVIATGVQYSVRQFVDYAAMEMGVTMRWEGEGVDECGYVAAIASDKTPALKVGDKIVAVDPRYFRPAEVETLLGDPGKAKEKLGWEPTTSLTKLVEEMMAYDLEQANRHALLINNGFNVSLSKE
jgi:GDPmannose 4,6-dehydratase